MTMKYFTPERWLRFQDARDKQVFFRRMRNGNKRSGHTGESCARFCAGRRIV